MKYVARMVNVLKSGIHKIGEIQDGQVRPVANLPLPNRIEIEFEECDEPCFMYRYTDANEFCGDTWHANLADAFAQAEYEYGLVEQDFVPLG